MNAAPEKAVRPLRVLSRVLCAVALTAPLAAAQSAEPAAAAWVERAADEARTITGRGAGLTAALSAKGQLLADAAGLAAAGGGGQAERWFTLTELCERALVHRQANGPVTAALVAGLARAGRDDEAATRAQTLPAGPDRERAHAALAGALAMANPLDPRAAKLRSAADSSAAAVWAPAFAQAGDFDGLAALVGGADLTDDRRVSLLAELSEAQARSGHAAAAQQTLDQALALGADLSNNSTLALAGAQAALGHVDAVADAVDALQAPADRVRGLSRLAAARTAAGDQAAALSNLRTAAKLAGRSTGDELPGAVRELTRVAADAGQAGEIGPWIDTLGDPQVRAAAALGLAEGLSTPDLRPLMAQVLTRPEGAAEPVAAVDVANLTDANVTAGPQQTLVAERNPTPAAPVDPSADQAGAKLNNSAQQAIDQAMAELPGSAMTADNTPEIAAAAASGSAAARLTAPEADAVAPEPMTDAGVDKAGPDATAKAPADLETPAVTGSDAPQQIESGRTPSTQSADPTATASASTPRADPSPAAVEATESSPEPVSTAKAAVDDGLTTDPLADPAPADAGVAATALRPGKTSNDALPLRDAAPAEIVRAIDKPTGAAPQVVQAAEPANTLVESKTPADAAVDAGAPDAASILAADTGPTVIAVPDLRRLADPEHAQFSEPSPAVFDARFTTTRGAFTLRVHRAWAPRAADRFYQLCIAGFYNNNRFFRAVPGFVVQWGIHGFPSVATAWRNAAIPDEPVRERNRRGTVSFAAAAVPNTRTTQVFINLSDNAFLDDLGFAPFAEVTQGMGVVEQLFSGYGESPSQLQRRIQLDGNTFLDANFPDLDSVVEVEIDGAPTR